jgi:hypothetical protein
MRRYPKALKKCPHCGSRARCGCEAMKHLAELERQGVRWL